MSIQKIIFINGFPASGKSTLVNELINHNTQCPIICKDSIKEILFYQFGLNNDHTGKQLNNAALNILYDQLEEHLRSGSNLILEGNFKPDYDQTIIDNSNIANSSKVLQIMLVADDETLLNRDDQRRKTGQRKTGHSKLDKSMLSLQREQVRPFAIKGSKIIQIDTTNYSTSDYTALVSIIKGFLNT